jgi:ferredoxin-NADP reductase
MVLDKGATWWVAGNLALLPVVLLGGILIVRKIHRWDLVLSYILATIGASVAFKLGDPVAVWDTVQATVLHTTLLFFAFVMITEPLTTPPRRAQRIIYGSIVGVLSAPWAHIGDVYFTPELALLAGNIVSYGLSPKWKSLLVFKEMRKIATDTYEYVFEGATPRFTPGQYAEFTIHADAADNRGNRRYFTFASSPTEPGVRLGIKFYTEPSTFKAKLARFSPISTMLAGSIAGDFVLPQDKTKKLVFIAGGIGVTPFRSMIKYLIDTKEKRDIVLFYSNKTEGEIAYRDVFTEAEAAVLGIKVIYTITDKLVASSWQGERGYVNAEMIKRHVPDFKERYFYVSGPHSMVDGFSKTLGQLGVRRSRMKKDFFPGFA